MFSAFGCSTCCTEVTQIPGWAPSVSLEVKEYVETGEEDEQASDGLRSV